MTNQELYHSFIRRLRKHRISLDGLRDRKTNASSISEQKEFILKIVEMEARINEIRSLMEQFNMFPKSVKEKELS